eukprot:scaffold128_cov140-Skeletonema_menzelii.AAC.3
MRTLCLGMGSDTQLTPRLLAEFSTHGARRSSHRKAARSGKDIHGSSLARAPTLPTHALSTLQIISSSRTTLLLLDTGYKKSNSRGENILIMQMCYERNEEPV